MVAAVTMLVWVENGWRENKCNFFSPEWESGEDGNMKVDTGRADLHFGLFVLVLG